MTEQGFETYVTNRNFTLNSRIFLLRMAWRLLKVRSGG